MSPFKRIQRKKTFIGGIPTSEEIEKAIKEYIKNGGKITLIIPDDSNYKDYRGDDQFTTADAYLIGQL